MPKLSSFCTCTNMECPLHLSKHDKGCAPCISKNLKLGEVPNCFFNEVSGGDKRTGDTFVDFAETVQAAQKNN